MQNAIGACTFAKATAHRVADKQGEKITKQKVGTARRAVRRIYEKSANTTDLVLGRENPANPMTKTLKGIMPAVASLCDQPDRFLEDEFARLVAWLYAQGVHGLYVCGATGDGYNMSLKERQRAAELAVKPDPRAVGQLLYRHHARVEAAVAHLPYPGPDRPDPVD
jgi:hypothetical protein